MARVYNERLRFWRYYYENKEYLTETENDSLIRILRVLKKLEPEDREVLTRKYFHLKNLPNKTFHARLRKDSKVAEEMGIDNLSEFSFVKSRAERRFNVLIENDLKEHPEKPDSMFYKESRDDIHRRELNRSLFIANMSDELGLQDIVVHHKEKIYTVLKANGIDAALEMISSLALDKSEFDSELEECFKYAFITGFKLARSRGL